MSYTFCYLFEPSAVFRRTRLLSVWIHGRPTPEHLGRISIISLRKVCIKSEMFFSECIKVKLGNMTPVFREVKISFQEPKKRQFRFGKATRACQIRVIGFRSLQVSLTLIFSSKITQNRVNEVGLHKYRLPPKFVIAFTSSHSDNTNFSNKHKRLKSRNKMIRLPGLNGENCIPTLTNGNFFDFRSGRPK